MKEPQVNSVFSVHTCSCSVVCTADGKTAPSAQAATPLPTLASPLAEKPELSMFFSLKAGVGQNMALCAYLVNCQEFCSSNFYPSILFYFIVKDPPQPQIGPIVTWLLLCPEVWNRLYFCFNPFIAVLSLENDQ